MPGNCPATFHFALLTLRQFALADYSRGKKHCIRTSFLTARMLLLHCSHDGRNFYCRNRRVLRDRAPLRLGVHPLMSPWELVMGSIMAVGLTAYLVYAMLRPEKF